MKVTQLLGSLAVLLLCLACGDNRIEKGPIKRSGQADVVSLDDDWRFIRYGLQADGTRVDEPAGMFEPATDDSDWETLDVPHDLLLKDRSGWTWRKIQVAFRFRESVGIGKPLQ